MDSKKNSKKHCQEDPKHYFLRGSLSLFSRARRAFCPLWKAHGGLDLVGGGHFLEIMILDVEWVSQISATSSYPDPPEDPKSRTPNSGV